jgi:hypothetical protein
MALMVTTAEQRHKRDIKVVLDNLNHAVENIKGQTVGGLLAGGLIVQREAQKHVPVEYGNLRGSAYTRRAMDNSLAVEIGFTANYAIFVHENLNIKHAGEPRPSGLGVFWGPQGEPKFLEHALTNKHAEILDAIVKRAKIA